MPNYTAKFNLCISLIILYLLQSCGDVAKESIDWFLADDIEEVEGNYHYLDDDGIKVFLPNSFKRYSGVEYEAMLRSNLAEQELNFELARLKQLRAMKGNLYIFYDELSYSTYTINTTDYLKMNKQDAKFLLGIIKVNHDKIFAETNIDHQKITAKFNKSETTQIFKAVYEVTGPKIEYPIYSNAYIVSNKGKTVFLNFSSIHKIDFDPYIGKMNF